MTDELLESVGKEWLCSEFNRRGYRLEDYEVYDTDLGTYLNSNEVENLLEAVLLLLE